MLHLMTMQLTRLRLNYNNNILRVTELAMSASSKKLRINAGSILHYFPSTKQERVDAGSDSLTFRTFEIDLSCKYMYKAVVKFLESIKITL